MANRKISFERRAFVAIACYFVVLQALLAAVSIGFAAGDLRRVGDTSFAYLCHGAGVADEAPAGEAPQKKALCGLCATVTGGIAAPPVPAALPAARFAVVAAKVQARTVAVFATFHPRAGHARAPPPTA